LSAVRLATTISAGRASISEPSTPALAPYRHPILDGFRKRAHVLDEKGERLLSLAGPTARAAGTIYEELSTTDIQFPTVTFSDGQSVKLAPGAYAALLESNPVQADRAKAAEAHLGAYAATAASYAATYKAVLERDWFLAQARDFPSTLDAATATAQGLAPATVTLPSGEGSWRNSGYALQWWVFALFALGMSIRFAQTMGRRSRGSSPVGSEIG